jgi:hypothetical protein
MAFTYRGQLDGKDNPVTLSVPVANSQTVVIGNACKMQTFASGGGCMNATAGSLVLGIVVGLTDVNGIDLDNTKVTIDGTWTSSSGTYVGASNNMTVKKIQALVVVDPYAIWFNDTAGDLAPADLQKHFDLVTAGQIADQNGADAAGAFYSIKLDPDGDADLSKGLFIVTESELAYAVQQ